MGIINVDDRISIKKKKKKAKQSERGLHPAENRRSQSDSLRMVSGMTKAMKMKQKKKTWKKMKKQNQKKGEKA